MATDRHNPSHLLCIAIILAATILTYRVALKNDFINYDDATYVTANPIVRTGLSVEGLRWALSATVSNHWHPVTWVSHMLDVELFELDPAGHHASSILIHSLNAILVYLFVQQWTIHRWQSVLAALLFSIHPLRVESVAWVADRKDLLGTQFFLLALLAYTRYARHPKGHWYLLVLVVFVLGLMSKAALVVTPLILLLMDYWPLERVGFRQASASPRGPGANGIVPVTWNRAVIEKGPLLCLSVAVSVLTVMLQHSGGNLQSTDTVSLSLRLSNSLWSCWWYIFKSFVPVGLSVFYPIQALLVWKTGLALLFVTGVTFASIRFRRSHPYVFVGWAWYLFGLIPVLGLVQVGSQARADHYSYLPLIGLCIAVTVAGRIIAEYSPRLKSYVIGAAVACLFVMALLTHGQVRVWSNSQTVFEHAIRWDPANHVAHNNLAAYLLDRGQTERAARHLEQAVGIATDYPEAYYNLGYAHLDGRRIPEAAEAFSRALTLRPGYAEAYNGLGLTFYARQEFPSALEKFDRALRFRPDFADALNNKGTVLIAMGRWDEAVLSYQQAVELLPHDVGILQNFADTLLEMGRLGEAANNYFRILQLEPNHTKARRSLEGLIGRLGTVASHQGKVMGSVDE